MKSKLLLFLALAGLFLAACAPIPATPTTAPSPLGSPTVAATATTIVTPTRGPASATATVPPPSPTPLSAVSPSFDGGAQAAVTPAPPTATPIPPTAAPTRVVLLAPSGAPAEALFQTVSGAAQGFGWQAEWKQDPAISDLRALAQAGAAVIIVDDTALEAETSRAAGEFPQVYFICVNLSESSAAPNLLALGGAAREDQAGFVAGMAAGYVTKAKRVAVIGDPQSAAGRRYRNGFLHGVRYTCPKCRVDNLDVLNLNDTANVVDLAAKYALYGVDVFFAAAGEAGNAALVKVAQAGTWVIGSGSDIYETQFDGGSAPGADHVLTSVYLNPASAVLSALQQYRAGTPPAGVQPLAAANGAIALAPYREETGVLSPLDQQDIADALTRLGLGTLDTGIDPETGEER